MDERSENEKMDEIMLPGFRFHPTDEELVGFYLRRKIQQKPLSIELIKQLDIYKFDPWDLPKLATVGEKEWYFYCPRDRKYRNSARPNRVTGAGFWKATGTDRPIYSSESSRCIGLKKSLVFYKGRAAKGIKTDWMMHEFRLPSLADAVSSKRYLDKNIPTNDSWAICRIFKKTNSNAQRALSHSWVSPPIPETTASTSMLSSQHLPSTNHFSSDEISILTKSNPSLVHYGFSINNDNLYHSSMPHFSPLDIPMYNKPTSQVGPTKPSQVSTSNGHQPTTISYTFSSSTPIETTSNFEASKCTIDASSLLLNMSSSIFGEFNKASHEDHGADGEIQGQHCNSFSITLADQDLQGGGEGTGALVKEITNVAENDDEWGALRSHDHVGYPFNNLVLNNMGDAWKSSNLLWDSSPCPSEISTSFSTNKCYI